MNRSVFFAAVRRSLTGGALKQSQVAAMDLILDEGERRGTPIGHLAYILATAYHEAGADMVSKAENLYYTKASRLREVWPSRFKSDAAAAPYVRNPRALANLVYGGRMGNRPGTDDGWIFLGRSYPQLTGYDNYGRAGRALGIDLVANPDRVLEPAIGIAILFSGMSEGWFTKYSLHDVDDTASFLDDRKVVNGSDSAALIAGYANAFLKALQAGGYSAATPAPQAPAAPEDAILLSDTERDAVGALAAWLGRKPAGADAVIAWIGDMPKEAAV